MPTTNYTVASTADLNAAIQAIDLTGTASAPNTAYTISFNQGVTLTGQLDAINLASGDTLAIQGNGDALNGGGTYNGLFDYAGQVTVSNLSINDTKASGGNGAVAGGGGAGLGGGVFVASGAAVTLQNVGFGGDSAVGGSSGSDTTERGAGGGLDGGSATSSVPGNSAAGGGGVGLSATGGIAITANGAGGTGIILGAAGGGASGTGAGGSSGGGGGADPSNIGGSGGGVGGAAGTGQYNGGGNGGFGGGGGYGKDVAGGSGGFGGGGGSGQNIGGNGGFGGGAGGGNTSRGTPGFGAGGGQGGGGLGAGADVFVQQGGSLSIVGGSLGAGTVQGGAGSRYGGGNGSGLGSGLFLQGDQSITLGAPAGQVLDVAGTIADEAGDGGSPANAGSLVIGNNAGSVQLDAKNTCAGGTTLDGGTFLLSAGATAGSGAITFAAGDTATLAFDAATGLANTVKGFAIGDTIDLRSAGLETGDTANGNSVTFAGGTTPVTLTFDPAQSFSGLGFALASDGAGGTDVTLTNVTATSIAGLSNPTINDNQTVQPFSGIVLTDTNANATESVTVTWASADGTLSDGSTTYTGSYSTNGSAATVQAALRSLTFTPTANQVAPGGNVPTTFSITDKNGAGLQSTTSSTVTADSVNDPPSISGTVASQAVNDNATIHPFATASVADPDVGALDSVALTLSSAANGTLSGAGLSGGSGGVYTLAPTNPTTLTSELQALTFTPTANQVAPGNTVNTNFTLSANDGLGGTSSAGTQVIATSVNDPPSINGTAANQPVGDNATIHPFANVAVSDPDVGATDSLTLTLSNAANGTLSGAALSGGSGGVYTLAATSPATLASELDALTFTPTQNQVPVGQTVTTGFTLTATDDQKASVTDTTTSVVATSINNNPVLAKQTLSYSVTEGQTTPNLYAAILANTSDPDPGDQASLTISSIGQSGTAGFLYPDLADKLLTYTADGYNPAQPSDSFTYTVSDPHAATVTGTVDITVTGASLPTQVGTAGNDTLTTNGSGQRLIGGPGDDTLNVNAAKALVFAGSGDDTVNVNAAQATIYGGPGANTITLGNTAQDTIVLQQGGTDSISGFKLNSDVLDLSQALAEAHVSATLGTIGNDVTVTASGSNATLSLTPAAQVPGSGATLATLQNVGTGVTLQTLISDGALKVA